MGITFESDSEEDSKVIVIGTLVDWVIAACPGRKLESIYEEIGSQEGLKRRQMIAIMAKWKNHPLRRNCIVVELPPLQVQKNRE
jgi:hypothetical protein